MSNLDEAGYKISKYWSSCVCLPTPQPTLHSTRMFNHSDNLQIEASLKLAAWILIIFKGRHQ